MKGNTQFTATLSAHTAHPSRITGWKFSLAAQQVNPLHWELIGIYKIYTAASIYHLGSVALDLLSKITQTMALPLGIGCHKTDEKEVKQSEVSQSFDQGTGFKHV